MNNFQDSVILHLEKVLKDMKEGKILESLGENESMESNCTLMHAFDGYPVARVELKVTVLAQETAH